MFFYDNLMSYFIGDMLKYSRSFIVRVKVGIGWLDRLSPLSLCFGSSTWQNITWQSDNYNYINL